MGVRRKMLHVIKSIYSNLKSRVKFDIRVISDFTCCLGGRQGECLSPMLFAMYLNDIEKEYILKDAEGLDIGMLKLILLLYVDDLILFANDKANLQLSLNILENYCKRSNLKVNPKTEVMLFRKGGRLQDNI